MRGWSAAGALVMSACGGTAATSLDARAPDAPAPGPLSGSAATAGPCAPSPIRALVALPPDGVLLDTFNTATGAYALTIGVGCPDIGDNVGALAIDRSGIVYLAGGNCPGQAIYRIDPTTGACVQTPYRGADCIGRMAFATDASSVTGETLYYTSGQTFGAIDPATSIGRTIGQIHGGANASATTTIPLAGGADGAVYAALVGSADGTGTEIDTVAPATGALTAAWQIAAYPTASEPSPARTFVAVGSDFYLFDGSQRPGTGEAVRFSPSDQSTQVIGAALEVMDVSANTCAR